MFEIENDTVLCLRTFFDFYVLFFFYFSLFYFPFLTIKNIYQYQKYIMQMQIQTKIAKQI